MIDEAIERMKKLAKMHRVEYEVNCNYYGKEVVDGNKKPDCLKRAEECEQIAEWLEELKAFRNNKYTAYYYNKGYSKAENDYHNQSEKDREIIYEVAYANGVYNFAEKSKTYIVKRLYECAINNVSVNSNAVDVFEDIAEHRIENWIDEIVEQLKRGGKNE